MTAKAWKVSSPQSRCTPRLLLSPGKEVSPVLILLIILFFTWLFFSTSNLPTLVQHQASVPYRSPLKIEFRNSSSSSPLTNGHLRERECICGLCKLALLVGIRSGRWISHAQCTHIQLLDFKCTQVQLLDINQMFGRKLRPLPRGFKSDSYKSTQTVRTATPSHPEDFCAINRCFN